ncbi:MAG: indolepyruvate ferredoxin oxidoreductase [SAR86 cluster bacterium]|uniref:Indolepyruvate ferredoxin oxidoreductase n=1 Tax=SAR86 cluster bacterium TaxID=2030880 RepID=A0A2A4XHS5_9GAMM|nr:MAG: indolepyruvate ferredoxin oxidoreductase [SAR86 cluster bacterium]
MPTKLLPVSLQDKYALDSTRTLLTGIEALARLPILQHQRDLAAGLNTAGFISGYRGSPLGNLDQKLWQAKPWLQDHNIVFQPGVNEDLAATSVWGSQQVNLFPQAKYDGVFAMWYGKGPGVDRSMDVFKHANAFGTSKYGGVLAVAGDDHACKSSTLPHQSEHMFIGASMPILSPASVQDILDYGVYGWELSRFSGCWVALKAITENVDSSIVVDIDPDRIKVLKPEGFELPAEGLNARWPAKPLEQERILNRYRIYAARQFALTNNLNKVVIDSPHPRLGIITTGKAYLDVLQALDDLGIDQHQAAAIGLRVFKLGMTWPLEPVSTHEFAKGLEEILVVEEKRSIIEDQLTGQLYNWPVSERPRVVGEFDEEHRDLLPNVGELTPAMIARVIAARISRFFQSEIIQQRLSFLEAKEMQLARSRKIVERAPHFCSGCPHNSSTKVPEGSMAFAGIGCHYMAIWMDRSTETFTQMGGEGCTWIGQAPFTDTKHVFQNLGDGTYFHSGLLAIRATIASGVHITYKILYNGAVAMTGGQPIDGELSVEDLIHQLRGEGVKRIAVVSNEPKKYSKTFPQFPGLTIDHRDEMPAVQSELKELPGTTVIIFDQGCAAEKRRRLKRQKVHAPVTRVFINDEVCEGCGDCSSVSNCLSLLPKETELGRKRTIDQNACNHDYSCLKGFCPSFVSVVGGELKSAASKKIDQEFINASELPEPSSPSIAKPWNVVITGIGGTGVLTVGSVLSMAAHLEGKGCSTLNQTGLAQKFGAVLSHVRIAEQQDHIHSVRIPAGDADLLLGCDLVVAASDDALAKLHGDRSHVIANDYESVTSDFIQNPDYEFPATEMKDALRQEAGSAKVDFINATHIAKSFLGDSIAGNFFLLGYALQKGLLPVSAGSIEQAIELNKVSVAMNVSAFNLGRRAVVDYPSLEAQLPKDDQAYQPLSDLDEIVQWRVEFLEKYQDQAYAQKYLSFIKQCREVFGKLTDISKNQNEVLSEAIARSYFKLLSYKDEYEVARLYSDQKFLNSLHEQFSGNFKLKFHLAPPLISRRDKLTGMPIKGVYGQWILKLFPLLAKLKFLRGTAFDIFSYNAERKHEKQLIILYEQTVQQVITDLNKDNYETALEIASLPDIVRGYGHVKEKSMLRFDEDLERLLQDFNRNEKKVVRLFEKVV